MGGSSLRQGGEYGCSSLTWEDVHIAVAWSNHDGPLYEDPPLPTDPLQVRYWEHLRAVSVALVERYAPLAPEAVANEACIRVAGYLTEHTTSASTLSSDGHQEVRFNTASLSALRHSGAMAILTFWKRRRAL